MKRILLSILVALPALMAAQAQNTSDHNFEVAKQLDTFNAIYKNLDLMYVDTLDAEKVIGTAIGAMLHSLDPYTEYYPAIRSFFSVCSRALKDYSAFCSPGKHLSRFLVFQSAGLYTDFPDFYSR